MIRDTTIAINSRLVRQLRLAAECLGYDCGEAAMEAFLTERLESIPQLTQVEEDISKYRKARIAELKESMKTTDTDDIP